MICERCGEVGETFVTEQFDELCEACQKQVEQQQHKPPTRRRAAEEM